MFSKIKNFFAKKFQKKIDNHQLATEEDAISAAALDELPYIANPGLIAAINALKDEETAANRIRFQSLMKESRFILVTTKLNTLDTSDRIIFDNPDDNNHKDFGIELIQKNDNLNYIIFTDMERFQDWQDQSKKDKRKSEANLIAFTNLCDLVMETPNDPYGVFINPGREEFLVAHDFFKQNSAPLLPPAHRQSTTIAEDKKGTIQPLSTADLSEDLIHDLNNIFKKTLEIHVVWAAITVMDQQPYFTLIVDCGGNPDTIIPKVLDICTPYMGENETAIAFTADREPFNSIVEQFTPIFIRAN